MHLNGRAQSFLCVPQLLFAVAMFGHAWPLSVILILDVLIVRAPWKVPRFNRSGLSYWAETVLNIVPIVAISAYLLFARNIQVWQSNLLIQIAIGILLGGVGIWISRFPIISLLNGDLASLMGPDKRSHITARFTQNTIAPPFEEFSYRVAPFVLAGPLFAIAAQVVFVLRHYLIRGGNELILNRAFALRFVAPIVYLAIFTQTGSILIPIIAHMIQNLPNIILEGQRFALSRKGTNAER